MKFFKGLFILLTVGFFSTFAQAEDDFEKVELKDPASRPPAMVQFLAHLHQDFF